MQEIPIKTALRQIASDQYFDAWTGRTYAILWISGVRTFFSQSILIITIVITCIQSFGGVRPEIFTLKLGRSKKAIAAEKSARRFLWGQIPIHILFTIWAVDFFTSPQFQILFATWLLGWLVVANWWLPKRFKAIVQKGDGDYFVVNSLEPEFLKAVQQRLESRTYELTLASSAHSLPSTD